MNIKKKRNSILINAIVFVLSVLMCASIVGLGQSNAIAQTANTVVNVTATDGVSVKDSKITTYHAEHVDTKVDHSAICINLENAGEYATATFSNTLTGDSKFEYVLQTNGFKIGFVHIVFSDMSGNELFYVGRGAYQSASTVGGMGYFYNAVSRVYSTKHNNGTAKTWTEAEHEYPSSAKPEGSMISNYLGMLPNVARGLTTTANDIGKISAGYSFTDSGYIFVDYDKSTSLLQIKVPFIKVYSEQQYHDENKVSHDYTELQHVIGEIDLSQEGYEGVKSAIENGYKISIRKDVTSTSGQKDKSVPNVWAISLNGSQLSLPTISNTAIISADNSVTVTSKSYNSYEGKVDTSTPIAQKGLYIDMFNCKAEFANAKFNTVLSGDSKFEYMLLGSTSSKGFVDIVYSDMDGNEIFCISRGSYQANDATGGQGYFRDAISGNYSSIKSNGEKYSWTADQLVYPSSSNPSGNTAQWQGMLPRVITTSLNYSGAGYIFVDYDATTSKLQIKAPFATGVTDTSTTRVERVIGEIDLSQEGYEGVKSAIENGYTISIRKDVSETSKQTSTIVPSVHAIAINGVALGEDISAGDLAVTADLGLEMVSGAYVRAGGDVETSGLMFVMSATKDAFEKFSANNDGYYTQINYGMLIMPADYITTYGALNYENVFGANAIYGFEENDAKTQILNLTSDNLSLENNESYMFRASIIDILEGNIARQFVARGYVSYVVNGKTTYIMINYAGGDIANNTRSIYDVAKKAIESGSLSTEKSQWLKENYVDKVTSYTVNYYQDGVVVKSIELLGTIGYTVYAPYLEYEGYTFDSASSNVGVTLVNGENVINCYFVSNN